MLHSVELNYIIFKSIIIGWGQYSELTLANFWMLTPSLRSKPVKCHLSNITQSYFIVHLLLHKFTVANLVVHQGPFGL